MNFEEGKITGYGCGNFEDPRDGRAYILENILAHHPTLPLGEFAIGTNTTAYRMAKTYGIGDRLPILIAEKMGPHFAVGDTCYSWAEDTAVFNPDGKEIIARDNEISLNRKGRSGEGVFRLSIRISPFPMRNWRISGRCERTDRRFPSSRTAVCAFRAQRS